MRVDGHKRTLMLPPALGDYRPAGAAFDDGALHVTFDGPEPDDRSPSCASASAPRRRAAERLAGEPPARHAAELPPGREARDELQALVALLRALRELVPPELQQQVRSSSARSCSCCAR